MKLSPATPPLGLLDWLAVAALVVWFTYAWIGLLVADGAP